MIRHVLLPVLASEHGAYVDRLLVLVHVFIAAVFLGWFVFFVYMLFRYRGARHPHASHTGARTKLPYYLAVAMLVAELALDFGLGSRLQAAPPTSENLPDIRVIAQQYAWNIHYPGADGRFGPTRPALVDDATNPIGLDRTDPAAADDIVTLNQLYLPVGRPVTVGLMSKDVVHSFNLPEFRVKQDMIPGMETRVSFTPTLTTAAFRALTGDAERTFEIACAQLCGFGHYRMRGYLVVLEAAEYATWLEQNAPAAGETFDPFWQ